MSSKNDVTDVVATATGFSKDQVTLVVDSFLSAVTEVVFPGGEVELDGFGTFYRRTREGHRRTRRNGKTVFIPARKSFRFRPCKDFRNLDEL